MLKPPSSSARRNKSERHEDGAHYHDQGAALHGFPLQASDGDLDRRTLGTPRSQVNRVSRQCTHTAPIDTPSMSPSPALTRASKTRLRRKSAPRPSEN